MSDSAWITCACQTMVIRLEPLARHLEVVMIFSEFFDARGNDNILVACSMGGDGHLEAFVEAAEAAGADPHRDMVFLDAFDAAFCGIKDGSFPTRVEWLKGRVRGGTLEVLYVSDTTARPKHARLPDGSIDGNPTRDRGFILAGEKEPIQ